MLSLDVYNTMFINEETWFVTPNGYGMIISDCSLLDC